MADKKINEFDDLFSDAPTKAPAAVEKAPVIVEDERSASPEKNEFDDLFITPATDKSSSSSKDSSSDKSVAAAVGAGYGAYKGLRKTVPTIDNAYTRWAERTYGLPAGSLSEAIALRDPSMPMTEAQANKAVASKYFGPAGAETRLPAGAAGNMPFNYAKSAGLTDIEAGQALDMTKQEGGTHDLATKRRVALSGLSQTNPTYRESPEHGGLMVNTSVGSGPRFTPEPYPDVWYNTRGGWRTPPPWSELSQADSPYHHHRGPSGPKQTASPLPTAPVASVQESSVLDQVAKKLGKANTASRGAQYAAGAGRGALGGGMTALQAYNMYRNYLAGRSPDATEVASLVGGPMAAFGGKILGPVGAALQIPYGIAHRKEIYEGLTGSDINPTAFMGMPEENVRVQPTPVSP